jgi:hypothetical protein
MDEISSEVGQDGYAHILIQSLGGNNSSLLDQARFFIGYTDHVFPEKPTIAVTAFMYTTAGPYPGGPSYFPRPRCRCLRLSPTLQRTSSLTELRVSTLCRKARSLCATAVALQRASERTSPSSMARASQMGSSYPSIPNSTSRRFSPSCTARSKSLGMTSPPSRVLPSAQGS